MRNELISSCSQKRTNQFVTVFYNGSQQDVIRYTSHTGPDMPNKRYYGPNNEYGPYTPQADGWPNAGEVIRDYRKRVKEWNTAKFARLYSDAMGEDPPVTERWIQRMEKENRVPADLPRRRTIARLLSIPPALLGIASLASLQSDAPAQTKQPTYIDIQGHVRMLDMLWIQDRTGTAQSHLTYIDQTIKHLHDQSKLYSGGPIQYQIHDLLIGHYTLASTIYADMLHLEKAYAYADKAVFLASNMKNNKLLAVALYQRGFVRLEQATFTAPPNVTFLHDAEGDLQKALPLSSPKVQAHVLLDLALINAFLKRPALSDKFLLQSESIVDRGGLYEGNFVDRFADIDMGRYRLGQASVFTRLKRYNDASDLLYEAKEGLNPTQTRRLVWADIIEARIFLGQHNYAMSAQTALQALKVCKVINSQENILLIQGIHSRLLETPYASSKMTKELGAALILL